MTKKQKPLDVPELGVLDMGGEDTLDLDALLSREFSDIDEACETIPALMEWVNMKLQYCIEKKLVYERKAKETEAKAWLDYKMGKFAEDYPSINASEKAIDKASSITPAVQEAYRKLALYVGYVERLRGLQLSIQMKYDLVRSSEATRRKAFNDPEPFNRPRGFRPKKRNEDEEADSEE